MSEKPLQIWERFGQGSTEFHIHTAPATTRYGVGVLATDTVLPQTRRRGIRRIRHSIILRRLFVSSGPAMVERLHDAKTDEHGVVATRKDRQS